MKNPASVATTPVASLPSPASGRGWFDAFRDLSREHGFEPLRIEGQIPAELSGTLYRNGPALFENFGRRYEHWFDGDGAVSAVRLSGGKAEGAIKLVQSQGLAAERLAQRPLYLGYGSAYPGSLLSRLGTQGKNAANTSVLMWQDRLFALVENGLPTELSPEDLSTLGERTFEGAIPKVFSAHPHRVPARRASYNFGVRFGRKSLLDIIEMPDQGPARLLTSLPISPSMVHDFMATDEYLIFLVPPMRLRVVRQLLGLGRFNHNFVWNQAQGTEVLVLPFADLDRPLRIETDAFFQFHFSNAYQKGRAIEFDVLHHPNFRAADDWFGSRVSGGTGAPHPGRLHRGTIDLADKSVRFQAISDISCEFPRVSPLVDTREHQYVYAAAHSSSEASRGGLFDQLVKIDVRSGADTRAPLGGAERYASEPVFVPRALGGAEDDGWLLAHVYDARSHSTHLAAFDARAMEAGAVGRAHFDHPLPFTFHGGWLPAKGN
jgi:all-trans-8'-apo-beta-carotenal 15,15'-oxygenase